MRPGRASATPFFSAAARLSATGARIALGSDTGVDDHFFGFAEQRELEAMVNAGMTSAQVIVAATSRGAEYLHLNTVGTLAAGKSADFLVLDANALNDIRNTRCIAASICAAVKSIATPFGPTNRLE